MPPRNSSRSAEPKPAPFHYTRALEPVLMDLVSTLEELRHVDLTRVGLSITQARQSSQHGTYATCVPLRFEGGAAELQHGKRRFRMPVVKEGERELLYLIYIVLPRFHEETDYHEKLATLIHELYHISPLFNGDLRRFPGKNFAHGHSREVYHAAMRRLATVYLTRSPLAETHEFLRVSWEELMAHPGGVVGTVIPKPRPVLVPDPSAPPSRTRSRR